MKELFNYTKKPELYERSTHPFWEDEHISKGMLKAHLNPELEAASRKHGFMEKSVCWIEEEAPKDEFLKVLDLGCGPGLYSQRLARIGYDVTGVDFSRRSIEYAKGERDREGLEIEYILGNYLKVHMKKEYDLAIFIYCDYGALTKDERGLILKKIYSSLRDGGKLILDVFTKNAHKGGDENHSWYRSENGGFLSSEKHICLESNYLYEDNINLDQYVIIEEQCVKVYRIWKHYFTEESLKRELQEAGFQKIDIYADVCGEKMVESSQTICVVAQK